MAHLMCSSSMRWWVAVEWIEDLLASGERQADEIEAYYLESRGVSVELRKREVHVAGETRGRGLGIRTIIGGKIGSSSTNDPEQWRECLSSALASAKLSTAQTWNGLPGPSHIGLGDLSFDPALVPDTGIARDLLEGMIEGAGHHRVMITSGSASLSSETEVLANSRGVRYHRKSTAVSLSMETISGQSTGSEFGISYTMDLDPVAVGEQAAFFASHSVDGREVATGDYDIILSPIAFAQLLGSVVIPALNGRSVHAGRSKLADSLGEQVIDAQISIYDDPFSPRGLGSTTWDGEGVPTAKLDLFRDGVLRNFTYDLKTAYRYGKETTASAVRSGYGGVPSIGYHNLVVDGPRTGVMDDPAIYVKDVVGAHTANPMSGDFSVELANPTWVEGGTWGDPVRKAMLSGNVFEMIRSIGGLGKDDRVLGSMILPSIRLNKQHIIGE